MDLVTYPSLIPDNLAHEMTVFLFEMVQRYYLDFNTQFELSINGSSKHVYKYLVKNMSYHGEEFHCMNYLYDKEFYRLIRKTWIGFSLEELSKLKSLLEKRCKDIEMDLDLLVGI